MIYYQAEKVSVDVSGIFWNHEDNLFIKMVSNVLLLPTMLFQRIFKYFQWEQDPVWFIFKTIGVFENTLGWNIKQFDMFTVGIIEFSVESIYKILGMRIHDGLSC